MPELSPAGRPGRDVWVVTYDGDAPGIFLDVVGRVWQADWAAYQHHRTTYGSRWIQALRYLKWDYDIEKCEVLL